MHDRDRRLLSWFLDLGASEQARALRQLCADDALRDVGDQLTIDRIRDVFKYAPAAPLALQIRDTLLRLMHQTELNVPAAPPPRRRKRREVDPPEG
jgi:hypothetical protein